MTTTFEGTFCDLRFDTAAEAAAARELALAVGMDALGGEFVVVGPDGTRVFTVIDAVRAWDARAGSLPGAAAASLWRAEHDLVVEADAVMTGVRAALMDGVARRVLSMRHALLLLAALRSVTRRVVA